MTAFKDAFGRPPEGVWTAPGRVNLIGEHTDYNEGFVLPLALQLGVTVAAARRADGVSAVRSMQRDGVARYVAATVAPGRITGWAAYVAGVAWALRMSGVEVPDAELLVDSDLPVGAGLSSSAALGCAAGRALLDLAGVDLPPTELALVARRAENDCVGAPTGVMDQLVSVHGRAGHAVLLDTRSLQVQPLPFDPPAHGLQLLVVDTRAPHRLADGQYAVRRSTCEQAASALGVPALRDLQVDGLAAALGRLPDEVSRRRVRHVVTENARVLEVAAILRSGSDLHAIGPALTASHASLREDFEVTVPQLDVAVEAALSAGAHGARMTGGGFGGCVIALVNDDRSAAVVLAVERAFAAAGFDDPRVFAAVASDGARRLT